MAEAVFRSKCPDDFVVDSAGTASYHIGKQPDSRTISTLLKHGIEIDHKAQQICKDHFNEFDLILCMDKDNYDDVLRIQPKKSHAIGNSISCLIHSSETVWRGS